jgi:hypothetical protein
VAVGGLTLAGFAVLGITPHRVARRRSEPINRMDARSAESISGALAAGVFGGHGQ